MKKIEFLFLAVALAATLMSLFRIPFGSILLILTFPIMALLYLPYGYFGVHNLGLKDLSRQDALNNLSSLKSTIGVGMGFSITVILIGSMFKLMSWPGANINLLVGLIGMGFVLIITLIAIFTNKSDNYFFVFSRAAMFGIIGLFLITLPDYAILEYKYQNYPSYIKAIKKSKADPNNEELRKQVREEYRKMQGG